MNLTPEEREIARLLSDRPCPVDEILAKTQLPAGKVLSILTVLALKGVVKNHPGKLVSITFVEETNGKGYQSCNR